MQRTDTLKRDSRKGVNLLHLGLWLTFSFLFCGGKFFVVVVVY